MLNTNVEMKVTQVRNYNIISYFQKFILGWKNFVIKEHDIVDPGNAFHGVCKRWSTYDKYDQYDKYDN